MSDVSLKNVCKIKGGSGFPEIYQGRSSGEFPFAKVSDMSLPGNSRFLFRANNYVDTSLVMRLGLTVFPANSVVFAKVGAAIYLNRRRILSQPTIIDNNMMGLMPTEADSRFLYHYMQTVDLGFYVQPGALPSVNQSIVGDIPFPSLALPEQRKIASILTTVDRLIEQTEALIEKYRRVKQGMMADLLSRGVDEHGKLRPTYKQAPQLYKQSELGWIPKEWEVGRLGDHILHFDSGWSPVCDAKPAGSGEVGSLKTTSITWDGFRPHENKRLPDDLTPRPKIFVQPDDILITRVGPRRRIGIVVHVGGVKNRLMVSDNMLRLRLTGRTELSPEFVPLITASHAVQSLWDTRKVGLAEAQMVITQGVVRNTPVPVPSTDEQTRILALHSTVLRRIQTENDFLSHLAEVKTGLMQDLLTGKVRVKVGQNEEAKQPTPSATTGVGV